MRVNFFVSSHSREIFINKCETYLEIFERRALRNEREVGQESIKAIMYIFTNVRLVTTTAMWVCDVWGAYMWCACLLKHTYMCACTSMELAIDLGTSKNKNKNAYLGVRQFCWCDARVLSIEQGHSEMREELGWNYFRHQEIIKKKQKQNMFLKCWINF